MRRPGFPDLLFGLALRAYPAAFRARFGDAMRETFHERAGEVRRRGAIPGLVFLLRTLGDVVLSGVRERVSPTLGAGRAGGALSGGAGEGLAGFVQDLRVAARSLRRQPGFSAVVVLTLALGVGANTAIFSVVNGVLLRPLPYPEAERLVTVWAGEPGEARPRSVMSRPDIEDLAAGASLEELVGVAGGDVALTGLGEAELVTGARVTTGLLGAFRLAPALGRDLTRDDAAEGAAPVVVLSHAFWQDRLGGDPAVVGRTLELQGVSHEVVGVAPARFDYPDGARLWRPYPENPEGCGRGCHVFQTIGRLAAGTTLAVATEEADALAATLAREFPDSNHEKTFHLVTLEETLVGDVRQGLWIMLGAVGLVLLIACANVAGLLLVRGQGRVADMAVRAAPGARRRRVAAQVLAESLVLAAVGGGLGVLLALGGVELFRSVSPGTIPRIDEVSLDPTVLAFTGGLVLLVALVFGLGPALRVAGHAPLAGLAGAGRRTGESRGVQRMRGALLASEVGLSLVLLVGAGLLLRSFAGIYGVDGGFETRNVVRFTLSLPGSRYESLDAVSGFYRDLEERLRAMPGVEAVGSAYGPPMGSGNITGQVLFEGEPEPAPGDERYGSLRPATPGYLETMRIALLRGRGIEPGDVEGTVPVALVNETFVRENFPDGDPMGARFEVTADFGFGSPVWTVVGVVADVRSRGPLAEPVAEVYVPQAQFGPGFLTVSLRARPGATNVLSEAREVVRLLDADLPLRGVETMREAVARQAAPTRFYLVLTVLFAGLAVTLAAVGLYGTVAYVVSKRTREIGLRMALGAKRASITRLVLGQGIRPVLFGLALGLGVAWAGSSLIASLLFQVQPGDPLTFGAVTLLLLLVATLATVLPARQAARIDPVEALRDG